MKIIIENVIFPYEIGCRLLKLKYKKCPYWNLKKDWNNTKPFSFEEICKIKNIEHRRIAILYLGIERLIKEVKPTLVDKKVISKSTTWVSEDGDLIEREYKDTYELYKVDSSYFNKDISESYIKMNDCHFVKCKDTSTDREYLIWVDVPSNFTAIEAIAWTIQTNLPEGNIESIIRQGDCILLKAKNINKKSYIRHLTGKEYKKLLILES